MSYPPYGGPRRSARIDPLLGFPVPGHMITAPEIDPKRVVRDNPEWPPDFPLVKLRQADSPWAVMPDDDTPFVVPSPPQGRWVRIDEFEEHFAGQPLSVSPKGNMTFGDALAALKLGFRVRRANWKNMHLGIQPPADEGSLPYIFMALGAHQAPWHTSHTDMLADDWTLAP